MSASEIERTLVRLAHEIVEKNGGFKGLGLVGIRRRGVPIAERLGKIIQRMENTPVPIGTLDITFSIGDILTCRPWGPNRSYRSRRSGSTSKTRVLFWWTTHFSLAAN